MQEKGFFGHPRGLATLFFTEFGERFSFYGLRALIILYMTATVENGGMGWLTSESSNFIGTYLMLAYIMALPGGFIADKFIGQRKAVFYGGLLIALGNFGLMFSGETMFYVGLLFIILGTGLLKPNVTVMVGGLYDMKDPRRDGAFSIFYMGINLGALLSPLICGFVAQDAGFRLWLDQIGLGANFGWHLAFGISGVFMLIGLANFVSGYKYLGDIGLPQLKTTNGEKQKMDPFSKDDKNRMIVIGIVFFFCILFWSAFEQAPTSLNLFANDLTRNEIFGWQFPSSWFQSVNSLFIIMLAPVFSMIWVKLANSNREPGGPTKFIIGLLGAGAGFLVLYIAVSMFPNEKVSPLWLTAVYLLHTIGELSLSPVGLSLMTRLSPKQITGFVMGIWFTATSLGNKLGAYIASFYVAGSAEGLGTIFFGVAAYCFIAAVILALLIKPINKLLAKDA